MKITIEKASIKDAYTLADLKISIWQTVYKNILPDEYLDNLSVEERENKYHKELSNDHCTDIYLLKSSQNIIGTLKIKYYTDEKNNCCASIEDLYILPQYHTKGFGGYALKYTVNEAMIHDCRFLTAWIIESNTTVRNMAIKYGFIETNNIRIHAKTGIELIKYSLSLNK